MNQGGPPPVHLSRYLYVDKLCQMFLPGFHGFPFSTPKKGALLSSISKPTEQPKLRTFWGMVAQPGQTSSWKMRRNTAKNRPEDKKCRKHHLNQDFSKVVACPLGVSDVARVIEPMPIDKKHEQQSSSIEVSSARLTSCKLTAFSKSSWHRSDCMSACNCLHALDWLPRPKDLRSKECMHTIYWIVQYCALNHNIYMHLYYIYAHVA